MRDFIDRLLVGWIFPITILIGAILFNVMMIILLCLFIKALLLGGC